MFLFDILEAILAYDLVKIRFIKEKEVILNGNASDKSKGNQLIRPGCLQIVLTAFSHREHVFTLKIIAYAW